MFRRLLFCVMTLGVLVATAGRAADHCGTAAGEDPHGEHRAALALFPASAATHRAVRAGDWSDPGTWSAGVPAAGAAVLIPAGVAVTLARPLAPALAWLRIEGTLRFASNAETRLRAATVLIPETGRLEIGSAAAPIEADHTARVELTPRTAAARAADPYDISGGLVSLGQVQVYGADRASFVLPARAAARGQQRIPLAEPARGWRRGDALLFPASRPGATDERRTLAAVSPDCREITLDRALDSDHGAAPGVDAQVPVGNLTRNVVFTSADPAARAHLMFMTHEGVHLSGALFLELGRTQAARAHTLANKDAAGHVTLGDNPIGRYPVHFHLRQGACAQREPLVFRGNAIVGGPKHGLVNHGGNVLAEDNVTYDLAGSHFFSENGSEIGAFRHNLAVYSRGSGDTIRSREAVFDFGHGGHGFWAQSPAVVIEGNYAFHHADAAYSIFPRPVMEFGQPVYFDARNRDPRLAGAPQPVLVSPMSFPFRFAANVAGNCGKGLELWNINTYATTDEPAVVTGCRFWETPGGALRADYTVNTRVEHSVFFGSADGRYASVGIGINTSTQFLDVDDVTITGFDIGVELPRRGCNTVRNCLLDNNYGLYLKSPVQPGRRTLLADNRFTGAGVDYYLAKPEFGFNGDFSLLVSDDYLRVDDARFPGQTVYWDGQRPDAVPFPEAPVAELKGRTALDLWQSLGLALAGSLAPADAAPHPRVAGLVGALNPEIARGVAARPGFLAARAAAAADGGGYTRDQNLDRVRVVRGKPGEPSGWKLATAQVDGHPRSSLTYVDNDPPRYELSDRIRFEIHPDDVRHGIELCGVLHDEMAGQPTIKNLITCFKDLKVDPDGYVTLNQCCRDAVGNAVRHRYRFRVTPDAPRRGANLGYYNQHAFDPGPPSPLRARNWWSVWGLSIVLVLCGQMLVRARRLRARRA